MQTVYLKELSTEEIPIIEPAWLDANQASVDKGASHPGSYMALPDGQCIHFQYGKNPMQERNGILDTELLEAMIARFRSFQEPVTLTDGEHLGVELPATMASPETNDVIDHLYSALFALHARQINRQRRNVRFKDKP